jgi:hypothetical protein
MDPEKINNLHNDIEALMNPSENLSGLGKGSLELLTPQVSEQLSRRF